ncbi:hypothetical protein [Vibrio caribbeanicus]|uniref:hypothetical protein n=1 Tax=Vibrio caribbeanicus TaxID=701175 RepID=UPI0022844803|nr:hypothetical protein [Vibrio caribbeanicus]MCY9845980.1 hypothetical protein [Vibrio caribbeanicus]
MKFSDLIKYIGALPKAIAGFLFLLPFSTLAGNESIDSFSKAKKLLEEKVYFDKRETLYCAASFDEKKFITPPIGFQSDKYVKRAKKVEWEHVVLAENFGRTFVEWRAGDSRCVNNKGKEYKGRRCANDALLYLM